jgi:hypothetical protein
LLAWLTENDEAAAAAGDAGNEAVSSSAMLDGGVSIAGELVPLETVMWVSIGRFGTRCVAVEAAELCDGA